MIDEITKEYLVKLMKQCEKCDDFSEGGDDSVDTKKVRFQDIYTVPNMMEYNDYINMDSKMILRTRPEREIREDISRILAENIGMDRLNREAVEGKVPDRKDLYLDEVQENKTSPQNIKIIYAKNGCGKTSFARIYALLCAYKVMGEYAIEDRSLERLLREKVFARFEVDKNAVPVIFFSDSVYSLGCTLGMRIDDNNYSFEKDIVYTIKEVLGDTDYVRAEHIYNNNVITLIVNQIDYYERLSALKWYLDNKKEKVHATVCTAPLYSYVLELMEGFRSEQYVIPGPDERFVSTDWIVACAKRWYSAIEEVRELERDVEIDFLLPLSRNAEVLSRISSVKELTVMLFSAFDNCLLSDAVSVNNRHLYIKLEEAELNVRNIIEGLAKAAYEMMDLRNEYIEKARLQQYLDVKADFTSDYSEEWSNIAEKLERTGILRKETRWKGLEKIFETEIDNIIEEINIVDMYKFIHEEKKAYFVAYAVKHNLMKDETKKTRFDYIKDKIANKDDAWRDSIICLAVIDGKLQGEIINELLRLAQEEANDTYYLNFLLEMRINPGIDFLFPETKLIFELLNKQCNWKLFDRECDKIERLARQCSQKECEQWVLTLLDGYQAINDPLHRNTYVKYVKATLVFCAEQCGMEDKIKVIL